MCSAKRGQGRVGTQGDWSHLPGINRTVRKEKRKHLPRCKTTTESPDNLRRTATVLHLMSCKNASTGSSLLSILDPGEGGEHIIHDRTP